MTSISNFLLTSLLTFPGILIAIVARGFGESFFAYIMGDKSQKYTGSLSLSPRAHVEPLGMLLMLFTGIGWGKPVYVNDNNFKNRRLGRAMHFIAGSITNIIVAFIFACVYYILKKYSVNFDELYIVISAIFSINVSFAIFTLLPLPPFPGYYFLIEILPYKISTKLRALEQYSMIFVLLILLFAQKLNLLFKIKTYVAGYIDLLARMIFF